MRRILDASGITGFGHINIIEFTLSSAVSEAGNMAK
jgi:hypothetical protein